MFGPVTAGRARRLTDTLEQHASKSPLLPTSHAGSGIQASSSRRPGDGESVSTACRLESDFVFRGCKGFEGDREANNGGIPRVSKAGKPHLTIAALTLARLQRPTTDVYNIMSCYGGGLEVDRSIKVRRGMRRRRHKDARASMRRRRERCCAMCVRPTACPVDQQAFLRRPNPAPRNMTTITTTIPPTHRSATCC